MSIKADVIIIGAGASGLMCAIEAGKRNRKVLILDHNDRAGRKLLMTGGGRCNFTNYTISADNYISHNPHFCKSALSRFTQWDFLDLIHKYHVSFHERAHGQLFCNDSANDILHMLLQECRDTGVILQYNTTVTTVRKKADGYFVIKSGKDIFSCQSLVVATGGLSIPTVGASPFGYKIAEQFGITVLPPHAALVPLTLQPEEKKNLAPLAGIAVEAIVSCQHTSFRENILFTHRGLSGPAILQISSYWKPGEEIVLDLLPDIQLAEQLQAIKEGHPQRKLKSALTGYLPKRLVAVRVGTNVLERRLQSLAAKELIHIADLLKKWRIKPNGTEGYRTAEVTAGGIDCNAVSSKTMECQNTQGLYFIGEVLDVIGWLGGYNLQWAWSSGWCAGQHV